MKVLLRFVLALALCFATSTVRAELTVSNLTGFGVGTGNCTATYVQSIADNTAQTTYSNSTYDFGAESPDRRVVAILSNRSGTLRTYSSGSAGGVSFGSAITSATNSLDYSVLLMASVPTGGASQNVQVTLSGAASRAVTHVWVLRGCAATAFHFNSSTASPPSATINVPGNGVVITGGMSAAGTTVTPTGYTEDYDAQTGGNTFSAGSINLTAAETGRTITMDYGTETNPTQVVGSFGP